MDSADARAVFEFATALMRETVNSRGYVQMAPKAAVALGALTLGLSRSADTVTKIRDGQADPAWGTGEAESIIGKYTFRVREVTEADQKAEAALVAKALAVAQQ